MKITLAAPEFSHFSQDWHLSPALDTGDFVFFSGITGCRPDYSLAQDADRQIRDAFEFLKANLAAADMTFANIVEMTTYHVDLRRHISTFARIRDEYILAPYPAWTAIGVSDLITEGTILEIRVIARRS
jgi:enamine deaminase RidA (YjgF/YER057c/UK114 family)